MRRHFRYPWPSDSTAFLRTWTENAEAAPNAWDVLRSTFRSSRGSPLFGCALLVFHNQGRSHRFSVDCKCFGVGSIWWIVSLSCYRPSGSWSSCTAHIIVLSSYAGFATAQLKITRYCFPRFSRTDQGLGTAVTGTQRHPAQAT